MLNADDNLDTAGGLNNQPDPTLFADRDFAFGGGGLDVLTGNTGGDRLIDWQGEFNSYFLPFNPFGNPTVTRLISPDMVTFVLGLGRESGADQGLVESNGELGLVTQSDPLWSAQNGSPRDVQQITQFPRDTQGAPEDDRGTALPLSSPGGGSGQGSGNGSDVTFGNTVVSQDPSNPAQMALFVGGTNASETIDIRQGTTASFIRVVINGVSQGEYARGSGASAIGRIIVYGNGGDDTITIFADLGAIDAVVYGGDGNDTLRGGTGRTMLDGGDGNDTILGGGGFGLLVGGLGQDVISGGSGDEILIGGAYRDSSDLNGVAAVLAVWSQPTSYSQRITTLRAGTGPDNYFALNLSTILDDGAEDSLDGGQGSDWFWAFGLDHVKKQGSELVN
jgi:Ca2+-binding RTX toxin-like protein